MTEGELWTAKQRQMFPIHYTISYRASFKPELPEFFIRKYLLERGVEKGRVLDPFGGRGTTALQANLMGFAALHSDLNPVSHFLASSRQTILPVTDLLKKLESLDLKKKKFVLSSEEKERFLPFFHQETLQEILNLRAALHSKKGASDPAIRYIGLTALSRLHGHSDGFFSVYSFPQISIMPGAQRKNNLSRGLVPEYRDVKKRIAKKIIKDLSRDLPNHYHRVSRQNEYIIADARNIHPAPSRSVDLVITSPPFLNKVDYLTDNWMRSWFLNMEGHRPDLMVTPSLTEWKSFMSDVIREMGRLLRPEGRAVIEVGEVVIGAHTQNLEEILVDLLPMDVEGGRLYAEEVYINSQSFTKLANCWDVKNNERGTNTNRCLVIVKGT